MELEKQLREVFAKQDPGPRFTSDVLQGLLRRSTRRKTRRRVLAGTLLVVAAAASMLALQLIKQHAQPVSVAPATVGAPPIASGLSAEPFEEETAGESSQDVIAPAAQPFTVALLPPRYEYELATHKSAVAAVHAALQEKLPSVPNLLLVEPDTPADFRLTVTGVETSPQLKRGSYQTSIGPEGVPVTTHAPPAVEWFSFKLKADIAVQGKNGRGFTIHDSGYLPGQCHVEVAVQPAGGVCPEPEAVAVGLIESLRKQVFPLDPSIPRALRARLRDRTLTESERYSALGELNSLMDSGRGGGWVLADLRAAMEIRMPDVQMNGMSVRARSLAMLRDLHDPAFIPTLLELLSRDADRQVRMEAAANLGQNFIGDAAVRSALEAAARSDSQQLVRQVALRSLTGEEDWREYVVATLQARTLSAAERVEPLLYMEQALSSAAARSAIPMPDDRFVPAAVELFPALVADEEATFSALLLLNRLSGSDHPAVKGLMMRLLRERSEPHSRMAAEYLVSRYPDAADVRRLLEEAAARDARIRDVLERRETPRRQGVD